MLSDLALMEWNNIAISFLWLVIHESYQSMHRPPSGFWTGSIAGDQCWRPRVGVLLDSLLHRDADAGSIAIYHAILGFCNTYPVFHFCRWSFTQKQPFSHTAHYVASGAGTGAYCSPIIKMVGTPVSCIWCYSGRLVLPNRDLILDCSLGLTALRKRVLPRQ